MIATRPHLESHFSSSNVTVYYICANCCGRHADVMFIPEIDDRIFIRLNVNRHSKMNMRSARKDIPGTCSLCFARVMYHGMHHLGFFNCFV